MLRRRRGILSNRCVTLGTLAALCDSLSNRWGTLGVRSRNMVGATLSASIVQWDSLSNRWETLGSRSRNMVVTASARAAAPLQLHPVATPIHRVTQTRFCITVWGGAGVPELICPQIYQIFLSILLLRGAQGTEQTPRIAKSGPERRSRQRTGQQRLSDLKGQHRQALDG